MTRMGGTRTITITTCRQNKHAFRYYHVRRLAVDNGKRSSYLHGFTRTGVAAAAAGTAVDGRTHSRTTHSNMGAGCPRRRRSSAARKTHPRVTCEGWLYRGRPQRQSVDRPLPPPATLSGRFTTAHVVCTSERTTTYRGHFLFRWSY